MLARVTQSKMHIRHHALPDALLDRQDVIKAQRSRAKALAQTRSYARDDVRLRFLALSAL